MTQRVWRGEHEAPRPKVIIAGLDAVPQRLTTGSTFWSPAWPGRGTALFPAAL